MKKQIFLVALSVLSTAAAGGLAHASYPMQVTDDTVMYDRLQEVKVQKDSKPDMESELESLAILEGKFSHRVHTPRQRIEKASYKSSKKSSGKTSGKSSVKSTELKKKSRTTAKL